MASTLLRKLGGVSFSRYRAHLSLPNPCSVAFYTKTLSFVESEADTEFEPQASSLPVDSSSSYKQGANADRPLEDGLDLGIYKAILVGQVGQAPIQKRLRSGKMVTLISLGTGGIRNNRRPLDDEDPKDYANRCSVQWHRVSVYPERLGELAAKNLVPGSILYVEGNLETKIFNDPITGLVRRIREVSVRRNGRLLVLGNGGEGEQLSRASVGRVGYY